MNDSIAEKVNKNVKMIIKESQNIAKTSIAEKNIFKRALPG